ncbi:uncharacterized protein CLUP02_10113 [Colletotrichum lupini]|uniref:Uncharacterized protein n=1 Tax=Colletotrichum lupini TaxID=145971 RepID=A0A9Q8SW33_9PEZI|nr:uncharacterized protein CLUP02_10113 [Colletotrichum lupini]UQC84616.1 hypothetical protein CLUP02_10113 [Colletotrichum lupini]
MELTIVMQGISAPTCKEAPAGFPSALSELVHLIPHRSPHTLTMSPSLASRPAPCRLSIVLLVLASASHFAIYPAIQSVFPALVAFSERECLVLNMHPSPLSTPRNDIEARASNRILTFTHSPLVIPLQQGFGLLLPTTYADCTVSHLPRRESRFRLQLMATAESSVQCCLHGGPTSTISYSMRAILSVVLDTSHLSDSATAH